MIGFKKYDKGEIFSQIDKLSIEKVGNQVLTKYGKNLLKVANVSNRYEIFDISSYIKEKIEKIEDNFNIKAYRLTIKSGIQHLQLISDKVDISGQKFYKIFDILNSSDKSRRLRFSLGLKSISNDFYIIDAKNTMFSKKHLNGLSKYVEDSTNDFNLESFDDQIESINSLVNHRISFSKMREVILGENVNKSNHLKFDSFKNKLLNTISLNPSQSQLIRMRSEDIESIEKEYDFDIDAFTAFRLYMNIFSKSDSHIVKKETKRVLEMTKWSIRNSVLEELGI